MNKKERDEAVAVEARKYCAKQWGSSDFITGMRSQELSFEDYTSGTYSRANLEWIVRRAVEMARSHIIDQGLWSEINTPKEIIAEIAKELEGGE